MMTSSVEDATSANSNLKVVEEFKKSFTACLTALRSGDDVRATDGEEIKTDAEIASQRLVETAQLTEIDFNKKYLLFSCYSPEEVLKQEISEMKTEIERKDMLINKFKEKLGQWQSTLRPNVANPSSAPSLPGFAPIQPRPHQQQQQPADQQP